MKAYISVSYSKRKELSQEIDSILDTLTFEEIIPFVFVDKYNFKIEDEEKMMNQATKDIDSSDFLIAEVSEKGIGIGVEVGYAKAKSKLIIYIRSVNSEHSTTISGISDYKIIYTDLSDLKSKLKLILTKVKDLLN